MAYDIELDKRVIPELKKIVLWYEDKSISAAERFEVAFNLMIEILSEGIIDFAPFTYDIKRVSIPDFPYVIYYSRDEESYKLFIHAILHSKRSPHFIIDRLAK